MLLSFNPRARDGREDVAYLDNEGAIVSIHAPVMDAKPLVVQSLYFVCFNPRARDGRETGVDSNLIRYSVSIHAPVMDAN